MMKGPINGWRPRGIMCHKDNLSKFSLLDTASKSVSWFVGYMGSQAAYPMLPTRENQKSQLAGREKDMEEGDRRDEDYPESRASG
jgi:hypothetical protein